MKDKNGIEICCENCRCVCKYDSMCLAHTQPSFFRPTSEAYESRIEELQKEIGIIQDSERAEAQSSCARMAGRSHVPTCAITANR